MKAGGFNSFPFVQGETVYLWCSLRWKELTGASYSDEETQVSVLPFSRRQVCVTLVLAVPVTAVLSGCLSVCSNPRRCVSIASGTISTIPVGTIAARTIASGTIASGTIASGTIASGAIVL